MFGDDISSHCLSHIHVCCLIDFDEHPQNLIQFKMQINLLTITSSALCLAAFAVEAFVPPQQRLISELASSFEDVAKRASDAVSLKSSRAEPISTNANVANPGPKVKEAVTKLKSTATIASRHAVEHKRWGIDNTNEDEYWHDSRIHTLGNNGFFGAVR